MRGPGFGFPAAGASSKRPAVIIVQDGISLVAAPTWRTRCPWKRFFITRTHKKTCTSRAPSGCRFVFNEYNITYRGWVHGNTPERNLQLRARYFQTSLFLLRRTVLSFRYPYVPGTLYLHTARTILYDL